MKYSGRGYKALSITLILTVTVMMTGICVLAICRVLIESEMI